MKPLCLETALAYAKRGLRVLPLEPRGKQPIGALVPHGVKDASGDEASIRGWFARVPTANVGIAVPDGWRVLDVDPRNGGDAELARLLHRHGELPATITARTGSGGAHYLFIFPQAAYRGKIGPGLDLLGPWRYFAAAPSVHPSGGRYAWTSPPDRLIAQAPAWLVARARVPDPTLSPLPRVEASGDRVERARKYLAKCPPAISGQGGHITTFLIAQKLVRGFLLDEATAFALLEAEWNPQCQPPWSRWDLRRKVREAARAGLMTPGALLDSPRRRA